MGNSRPAATLVEFAVVALVTMLILAGFVVGGTGVYRYNLMATLAREGSRYASVHGTQYAKDTGGTAVSSSTAIRTYLGNSFAPNGWNTLGLDPNKLTCSASWTTSNSPYRLQTVNNQAVAVNNTVTVTITYQWIPELFFGGSINLTSTSVTPMTY
jgi:Flp pilus assembly protein TadG